MALLFQILLGLLLLGSFLACYFCSKYWHWSHVLLTETVFLLSLAFLILSAEVFRIQRYYGEKNEQNLARIKQVEPLVEALQFGTDDQRVISRLEAKDVPVQFADSDDAEEGEEATGEMLSVRDLDHELGMVSRARGRVWRDANISNMDRASLTVSLTIPAPDPHGIETGSILYAFEQGEPAALGQRGPRFIGEFRVTNSGPQQVQLQPASKFDDRSIERLGQTQPPWILYENMPVDQYPNGQLQILANRTGDQLQQLIPPQSLEEYARHGAEARPGDDDWHKWGFDENGELVHPDNWDASTQFVYRRSLRDYNLIFQDLSKRYTQMEADYNALNEDNQHLEKALASAQKLQQVQQADQAKLNNDVAGVARDRQAIDAHRQQVETQLSNARALLSDLIQQNAEIAGSMQ